MNLVFLGPPGAGKGTIAKRVSQEFNLVHISTGDLFRQAIATQSELGKQVQSILAAGDLVPLELTVAIVKERLGEPDIANGFILDGFPRTLAQAEALEELTNIDHVINFEVSREVVLTRLSGRRVAPTSGRIYHILYNPPQVDGIDDESGEALLQRPDDQPEAILHRLDVYQGETEVLISHYRQLGLLRDVDASGTPEEVFTLTAKVLRV